MRLLKILICCLLVLFSLAANCELRVNNQSYQDYASTIQTTMPDSWEIVEVDLGVIPHGHHEGREYSGVRGTKFLLKGEQEVLFRWKDGSGEWHGENLAVESLEIWVLPEGYRRSWRRLFTLGNPDSARLILKNDIIRVYALPGHHWLSEESQDRFYEIVPELASISSWPNSPSHTGQLSWSNWEEELANAFRRIE